MDPSLIENIGSPEIEASRPVSLEDRAEASGRTDCRGCSSSSLRGITRLRPEIKLVIANKGARKTSDQERTRMR